MSYADEVRAELARLALGGRCCRRAELSALVRALGILHVSGAGQSTLEISSENAALARRVFQFLKQDYKIRAIISVGRRRTSRVQRYRVQAGDRTQLEHLLEDLLVWNRVKLYPGVKRELVRRRCCRRSYLRGFFLGRGSINDPSKGHHLEMVAGSQKMAQDLAGIMRRFDIEPGLTRRKNDGVIYLKDAEAIGKFLSIIGAHEALFQFENVRVYRDLKEQVNRLVNMETANLTRMVEASGRHVRAIELIDEHLGLHKLPRGLREVAETRLRLREASLEELGQSMSPPLGKSAVNHRLRRLLAIAADLKKGTQ
ncbi:MAG: DNA-binding protein WhiA [Bacillota bacterium]